MGGTLNRFSLSRFLFHRFLLVSPRGGWPVVIGIGLVLSGWPAKIVAAENLSTVDLMQSALDAYFGERYREAAPLFQRILRADPSNVFAQKGLLNSQKQMEKETRLLWAKEEKVLRTAWRPFQKGDLVSATDIVLDILERTPEFADAGRFFVEIRRRAEKDNAAAKPQSTDWRFSQGVISYIDQDWLKASHYWNQVRVIEPDRPGLSENINRANGRLEKGQRKAKASWGLDSGRAAISEGRYDEAVKTLREALALDPENPEIGETLNRAIQAEKEGQAKERAREVQEFSVKAIDLYSQNKFRSSFDLWKRVLALEPSNALARDYLSRMRERERGLSKEISQTFAEPDQGPSRSLRDAMELAQNERFAESVEKLERLLESYPKDAGVFDALEKVRAQQSNMAAKAYSEGLTLYAQGDGPNAMAKWKEALRIFPAYHRAKNALVQVMRDTQSR